MCLHVHCVWFTMINFVAMHACYLQCTYWVIPRHPLYSFCWAYQSFCMSVTLFFWGRGSLESTVWRQHSNIFKLIVLDFWIKAALFFTYGVICSPWTLLCHIPDAYGVIYSPRTLMCRIPDFSQMSNLLEVDLLWFWHLTVKLHAILF